MPDRAWERGLHQMIEAKEGLELSGQRETLARITYQRFFRRYLRLAGMTGTATEVAAEIGRVYGLPVVRVPLHRPSRGATLRRALPARRGGEVAGRGRDVRHAWRCEQRPAGADRHAHGARRRRNCRRVLAARGIAHVVLNAKQDRDEAADHRAAPAQPRRGHGGHQHGRARHRHRARAGRGASAAACT